MLCKLVNIARRIFVRNSYFYVLECEVHQIFSYCCNNLWISGVA